MFITTLSAASPLPSSTPVESVQVGSRHKPLLNTTNVRKVVFCVFWSVPEAGANNGSPAQQASFKCNKRRRYKKVPIASMTTVEIQKAELEPKKIAENTATPSNAHPLDEHVSTSAESDKQGESVDLLKCEEVNYETRNRAPGVKFRMPDGEGGWTPVVRKRSRSRRQDRMLRQDEDSGSD